MPDRNDRLSVEVRSLTADASFLQRALAGEARYEITGASVEARALILASIQDKTRERIAVVVPGDAAIDDFESALRLFHRDPRCVSAYPSPSLSPYQELSSSLGIVREEIRALGMLIDQNADLLIVPARALFARLPRAESFNSRIVRLAEGQDIDVQATLQALVENGFVRADLVGEAGEFAFRGGILDLFAPNEPKPVRVELFGDTIDSLRWFDVESQRSENAAGPVSILPMTHFPATKELRSALARRLSLDFMDPLFKRDVVDKIDRLNEHGKFTGVESFLPVVANATSFADYLAGWEI